MTNVAGGGNYLPFRVGFAPFASLHLAFFLPSYIFMFLSSLSPPLLL